MPSLSTLPLEILEHIAALVTQDASIAALLPLQLTCRHFYNALGIHSNAHLFADLFADRFDVSAATRRLGPLAVKSSALAFQLVEYCNAVRAIRTGDVHAPGILDTFWTAFVMLIEDDSKNRRTLNDAGLPDFVDRFVRERLYENHICNWPVENAVNSLALWLLWLTTSQERLQAESPEQRAQLIRLILPYVLMPVRYSATFAPYVHFSLPLPRHPPQAPHTVPTLHGAYPRYRFDTSTLDLYGIPSIPVAVPLASVPAKLVYISRLEMHAISIPPHLPLTRQHAIQLGRTAVGPTHEDVHELNALKISKPGDPTVPSDTMTSEALSTKWDNDWNRLTDCTSLFRAVSLKRSHYTPGTLAGLWQGRMLVPHNAAHALLLQTPEMPPGFSEDTLQVMFDYVFMRLREYHCMDVAPHTPVPAGNASPSDRKYNAWFPAASTYHEHDDHLTVSYVDGAKTETHVYRAYRPDGPSMHDEGECRGCQYRGTSEIVLRSDDARYLGQLDEMIRDTPLLDGEEDIADDDDDDDDAVMMDGDADMVDVDMAGVDDGDGELVVKRRCDGIMDIVFVGETDTRHGQAWHPYRFYGRVREWDGLIALARIPDNPELGARVFMGYVVGGTTLVGNWRIMEHPNEPVTFEGAWVMSKRAE